MARIIRESKRSLDDILPPHVKERLLERLQNAKKHKAVLKALVRAFADGWSPRGRWAVKVVEGKDLLATFTGTGRSMATLLAAGMTPYEGSEIKEIRF